VNAIGTETVTSPVLDAVLTLARRLNMSTVAEGVETPEQAAWLREHGVNFLGLLDKPPDAAGAIQKMAAGHTDRE
jgi:EAL domain-containing protein (putative c-di-GMP-specific phosphodiesterase class I)